MCHPSMKVSTKRRPRSVAWATVKAFDAVGGPPGRDPKDGGYRTTGGVEALARWADIAPRAFTSLSCDSHPAAPVHCEKSGLGRALSRGAEVGTCCLVRSLNGPSALGAVVVIAASMVRFAVIRTAR